MRWWRIMEYGKRHCTLHGTAPKEQEDGTPRVIITRWENGQSKVVPLVDGLPPSGAPAEDALELYVELPAYSPVMRPQICNEHDIQLNSAACR